MAKDPSFPFYAQDFLAGVMHLDFDLRGRYITMLAYQWNNDDKIPKKRLGFLVGYDWLSMPEDLKEKFEDCGEYIVNTRLLSEREKRDSYKEKQSLNGKKGGRPKKNVLKNHSFKKPIKSQKKPLEDENEYEKEKEIKTEKRKGGVGEKEEIGNHLTPSKDNSICDPDTVFRETLENEKWMNQLSLITKTEKKECYDFAAGFLSKWKLAGKLTRYPLGSIKLVLIEQLEKNKNGTAKIQQQQSTGEKSESIDAGVKEILEREAAQRLRS